jgi:alpha-beta hydrolase superfamily lysophospholipase
VPTPVEREKVRFASGDAACVAWHHPGTNGGCVVMAGGFAMTKEPGTDRFARRFADAGFSVLAFDHRHLGESGGHPRQIVRIREQLADWRAAIAYARGLPGVDPARVAIWGFSLTGGHILPLAAHDPSLAAAIAQSPHLDGPAAARNAARFTTRSALLRFTGRALADAAGSLLGRAPRLIPTTGRPGTVALLSTPDALDGFENKVLQPDWPQEVAARSALRASIYRPGRFAARVRCPLLIVACDEDQSALAAPAVRAAAAAPRGELLRLPGGHYAPFLTEHERAVEAELAFLRRHLVDPAARELPAASAHHR